MSRKLPETEFEDLSARFDGELAPEAAARADDRLRADPAWQAARAELETLDRLLEAWRVPDAPAGLAERILRGVPRRRRTALRLGAWLIPAAAAAAAVIAALWWWTRPSQTAAPPAQTAPLARRGDGTGRQRPHLTPEKFDASMDPAAQQIAAEDAAVEDFAREHLDFFQDFDVVANFETLQAIDRLESGGPGT